MHIYFSGIGGAGIGPLVIITKQAGFEVSGSDMQNSQYTDYLQSQGIRLHIGQSQKQIAKEHKAHPIDWVVFSSAVLIDNPNHPELLFAKAHSLKISKRDECLNTILKQKELKLIAVAGTHGKTSTTALVVWLFMQLQTPISYSVGAKLSFGPMGLFDPSSNYFVYECDEFDHNFLSFYPEISIITSVDWDHHDIYPTRQEYKKAFRHFIVQSTQTYIFDKDNSYLELDKESKIHVLQSTAKSLDKLQIPGLHNRQNSYIASKAVAAILGKNLEEVMHLANNFPGTSRRLERLASNIYSDYAHTPEEIAATLQLASEISKNVVVVYEPLTNRRQHYMKNQYKAAFSGVKKLYWLPSYLAREDPNLEILSPQELISYLDNPEIARAMKKNDELKNVILNHAKNGDMVICMAGGGGNSLDEWVRKTVV
ncbi:hypothetical protein KBB76_00025 [Candidatus Saccharibacteria bacterium]|nr:hypothetical protein [Candidatus Saccharibacteria bacterium]